MKLWVTESEWQVAKRLKKDDNSVVKRKSSTHLQHTFLPFRTDRSERNFLGLSRHYYLGKGGFGKVKLAHDQQGVIYAVKISNLKETLTQEFIIHKRLGLKVDLLQHGNKHYLLQEYHKGIDLTRYITTHRETLSLEQRRYLAQLLVGAVMAIHAKGVLHNDLKGNNVMVIVKDGQLSLRLVDFGAAQIMERGQSVTPGPVEMPEVLRPPEVGKALQYRFTTKTEIYQLALILKHLLRLDDDIINAMLMRDPLHRPSLTLVERYFSHDSQQTFPAAKKSAHSLRILHEGYGVLRNELRSNLLEIENELFNLHMMVTLKDGDTLINYRLPDHQRHLCKVGAEIEFEPGKVAKVVTADQCSKKYHKTSIPELIELHKSMIALEEEGIKKSVHPRPRVGCKFIVKNAQIELLKNITYAVRTTKSIKTLHLMLQQLKEIEAKGAVLQRETSPVFKLFQKTGMSSTWQDTMHVFKKRAKEIAKSENEILNKIKYPEDLQAILNETSSRKPFGQSTRLQDCTPMSPGNTKC